jgi:hypothetical protein
VFEDSQDGDKKSAAGSKAETAIKLIEKIKEVLQKVNLC